MVSSDEQANESHRSRSLNKSANTSRRSESQRSTSRNKSAISTNEPLDEVLPVEEQINSRSPENQPIRSTQYNTDENPEDIEPMDSTQQQERQIPGLYFALP